MLPDKIALIDQLRNELDGLRPLSKEAADKLWQKLRLEWDYNSSHIEGNTLTYDETMLLLLHGDTTGDHDIREYDEMRAHDVAIHMVKDWANDKNRDITESDIKNLNKIILVQPFWKEALTYDRQPTRRLIKVGDYKEHPNSVRLKTGGMFHYASPDETPRLMQELMDWYRSLEGTHPIQIAAEFHYKFIRIHPFDDGNGRIARLLVNYVLMRNGYTPIIIKSADKENYLAALRKADAGDGVAFISYLAEQQIWTLELEIKAAKGESIEEPDDIDKEIILLKKDIQRKSALEEKGTYENIYKAIYENIIPLIIMFDRKLNELKDLFFDYERTIRYSILGAETDSIIGTKESDLNVIESWLEDIKGKTQQVTRIGYYFGLKGLKKTIDGINIWTNIEAYFTEYNYTIKTPYTNPAKVFPYGKLILEEDKRLLINTIIRDIITRIKETK